MELKENTGMVFRNEYKKEENHPDFKGKINVDGTEKEIALWSNPPKDGKKGYFGIKISDPYVTEEPNAGDIEKEINPQQDDLPF
jgi:uncharacterized protein (DUF736 family)